MKRKNRKVHRKGREWIVIHDALLSIIERMRYFRATKDYFKMGYYGRLKDLRREVLRILNAIDTIGVEVDKEIKPYRPDRWE